MSVADQSTAGSSDSSTLIYVVDDEPMLLDLASFILEPAGYKVKTFRDPEVALEALAGETSPPGVLVTDYAMHTMNGMELIEKCRSIKPEVKVLLVSGTVGEEIFKDSDVKPDGFLAKPYQARQLTDAVAALINE